MLFFLACVGLLVLGYFTYGAFVERIFGPDPNRKTPCWTREDGVDYINMPTWKVFFIQLLDIAGLGPIFGPILGGWLIDNYSWHWIFLINLPIGLVALGYASWVLPKDTPHPSESFDWIGMALMSPGLALFLYGVSSIPGEGTEFRIVLPREVPYGAAGTGSEAAVAPPGDAAPEATEG